MSRRESKWIEEARRDFQRFLNAGDLSSYYEELAEQYPIGASFTIKNGNIPFETTDMTRGGEAWLRLMARPVLLFYAKSAITVRPEIEEVHALSIASRRRGINAVKFSGVLPLEETELPIAGVHVNGVFNKGKMRVIGDSAPLVELFEPKRTFRH